MSTPIMVALLCAADSDPLLFGDDKNAIHITAEMGLIA